MQDISLLSDEDLVRQYRKGSERAFEELYSRYAAKLKRIIYYYIYDTDDAEDIFHDVTLRVIRHIESFDLTMSFSSWVYQIAINCSKNYIKRNKKNETLIEKEKFRMIEIGQKNPSPEEAIISDIDMNEFNRAVESLEDKFKDVFVLRFDHGIRYSKISSILNCSERTAKWRMKRAIEKITQHLKERDII